MIDAELAENISSADGLYNEVVQDMHGLYDDGITEGEAREAASNLIGFCRTLFEIKMELQA